jgi:uncharacterized protein YbaA (DUF1428 family)
MTTNSEFKNHVNKCKKVIQKFGTTRKFECAGFIMPDGRMINFCKKGKHASKYDHVDVQLAYPIEKYDPFIALDRFMIDCRAVRFSEGNIEKVIRVHSIKKPTEAQVKKIVKAISLGADRFYGYKFNPKGNSCELSKDNPRGLDVRRWINKCWR